MAGFKLMVDNKKMGSHFDLINKSTLVGNYNTGQAIDPFRQRLDQKSEFAKIKRLGKIVVTLFLNRLHLNLIMEG